MKPLLFSPCFLLISVIFITSPTNGEDPTTSQVVVQELKDLKRQADDNKQKIRKLEERLTHGKEEKSSQGSTHTWPQRYLEIPNTNSAVRLILNPSLAMSYDFNGFAGDFISPPTLPLFRVNGNALKSGQFNAQAKGTQLGFRTLSYTNIGEIKTYVSIDFYGNTLEDSGIATYQPRLCYGYVEFAGFTAGQTRSNFLDFTTIGETVDYGTIMGQSFFQPLIMYSFKMNPQTSLNIAAERSVTDYTDNAGALTNTNTGTFTNATSSTSVPDATFSFKYESDSHFTFLLRGLLRELKIKDYPDVGQTFAPRTFRKTGWGLGVSGKLYVYYKSNIFGQVNFGDGIGHYIFVCDGQAAFYNQTTKIFDLQKAINTIIGIEHYWSDSFRSNIIYARTRINVSKFTPVLTGTTRVTKIMNQFFVNLFYCPVPHLNLGLEYGYADRITVDSKKGKANRITFGVIYNF